jgi:D-lyxose ketol-isomerase
MKTEQKSHTWKFTLVAGLLLVAVTLGGCQKATTTAPCCSASGPSIEFDNATFYDANGTFLPDVAKDAYITLMEYHGYPVFPDIKEKLWVSDYGTGQFTKLGLGANSFINNEEDRYMSMDLFLLPGQMLPEHFHLSTDKNPSKMEGWTVRHGVSYVYGEGEPTVPMKAVVPQCHMKGTVTVKHEVILSPGEFTPLVRATAPHWQFGGPEGTIMTETATVHDNDGVRHSDLNLVFP